MRYATMQKESGLAAPSARHLTAALLAAVSLAALGGSGCNALEDEPPAILVAPEVTPYFNETGTREGNQYDTWSDESLIAMLDSAEGSIDAAIYGFSNRSIIDAILRAHDRGVIVRAAGDARHFAYGDRGYQALQRQHVPMQLGNQYHIMHNKFFVIDGLYTFVGTGNITTTGFQRNNNNWVLIESPRVAADFAAEFEQMFSGLFSTAKKRLNNGNTYRVGDTTVEVYFSPQEDAMGRILEEVEKATDNIHFTIFAFTKDQVGSLFITKHREFQAYNRAQDAADLPVINVDDGPMQPKKVVGILDRSQIHGNFLYHEVYRMIGAGVPMKLDANEASYIPGDYQAGGGRLHSKTMIIDRGTPNARVLTGSFNWSSAATIANDETLLILRGERITEEYYQEFVRLWKKSKSIETGMCNYLVDYADIGKPKCADEVDPGDVIISEVFWDGWNDQTDPSDHTGFRDDIMNDEFIELYNTTNDYIDLSLWTITNGDDFKVGFTPGTVIGPREYFLVLDHNIAVYSDAFPQRGVHGFRNGDYVMNLANDPRFPRMNLKDSSLLLELKDTRSRVIDQAGDGGIPFYGGVDPNGQDQVNRSMERIINGGEGGDGTARRSWKASGVSVGGENVNPEFREFMLATPGEANSR